LLVENGSLVGYGFVPFHAQFSSIDKWRDQIDQIIESNDSDTLLKQYIRSNPSLNIVRF
jgi:hypothetical protein